MSFFDEQRLLGSLKGDGGDHFRRFMNALIAACASVTGIPTSDIDTQASASVNDGGVDLATRRGAAAADSFGFFATPTAWQFKSSDGAPSESDIRDEVNKPEAKRLILEGAAYRLVYCWQAERQTLVAREAILTAEVQRINPAAPAPRLLDFASVVSLAKQFPAILLEWFDLPDSVKTVHRQYAAESEALEHYVPIPDWANNSLRLAKHFDFAQEASDLSLCIQGQSGVGKTRLVLEAAIKAPGASAMILYVEEAAKAKELLSKLARMTNARAIIIADECDSADRLSLQGELRGTGARFRLVTIDNSGEYIRGQEAIELPPPPIEAVNLILEKNFPTIPADQRASIAQLCEGYLRFAVDVCRNPENLDKACEGAWLYLNASFQRNPKLLKVLSAIALFHKIGFRDEFASDLAVLKDLTGLEPNEIVTCLMQLNKNSGFVRIAGRFAYVTPQLIADAAFGGAFGQFLAAGAKERIAGWPARLQEDFWRQCENGGREVKAALAATFRDDAAGVTAGKLADTAYGSFYCHLAKANPEVFFAPLCAAVERASAEEVAALDASGFPDYGTSTRRRIVWLSEQLSAFPEYFEDVERLLFVLACHESERGIADTATRHWRQLFAVQLSGTSLALADRLQVLKKRINSDLRKAPQLLCAGVATPLSEGSGRSGRPSVISGRLPPPEWRPKTYGELFDGRRLAMEMLTEIAIKDESGSRCAQAALVKSFFVMTAGNLLDGLQEVVERVSWTEDERGAMLAAIDQRMRAADTQKDEAAIERWRERMKAICELLAPKDLVGQVKTAFSRDPWHLSLRTIKDDPSHLARTLGEKVAALDAIPEELLNWLASPKAKAAGLLGQIVADNDPAHRHYSAFLEAVRSGRPWGLLRGYLRQIFDTDKGWIAERSADLESLSLTNAPASFDLSAILGDSVGGFDRCLRLATSGAVHPNSLVQLQVFVGDRRTTAAELLTVGRLLKAAAEGGREHALGALTELLGHLAYDQDGAGVELLGSPGGQELAWFVLDRIGTADLGRTDDHYLLEIARIVGKLNPKRAVDVAAMILRNWTVLEETESEKYLAEVALLAPEAILEMVAHEFLVEEADPVVYATLRPVLEAVPSDVIRKWLPTLDDATLLRLAEHLPGPSRDPQGKAVLPEITRLVLERDSSDRIIRAAYFSVYGTRMWWGNPSKEIRAEAALLREFLADPIPGVRKWVETAAGWRDKDAARHDQEAEEDQLR